MYLTYLQLLDGLIDVYMPDFKFWTSETSQRLCKARDYPEVTRRVVQEMHRQVGDLCFDERGLAKKGVLLRHLVMPNYVEGWFCNFFSIKCFLKSTNFLVSQFLFTAESKQIMDWVAESVSKDTYVHIMEQYRPEFTVGKGEKRARSGFTKYEEIDRPVNDIEMQIVQVSG